MLTAPDERGQRPRGPIRASSRRLSGWVVRLCPCTHAGKRGTLATVRSVPKEALIGLFVAQHRHFPEACPALPESGDRLLSHVSAATAARYGVTIEAEALIGAEHVLLLVVEAASQEAVERFLAALPCAGDLIVRPAFTAEEAVARGGCGPTSPPATGNDQVTRASRPPSL